MAQATPRKKISKMNKDKLTIELKEHRTNEEKYHSAIHELEEMKKEFTELKESFKELKTKRDDSTFNPQTNLEERLIELERRMSEQEHYSRREFIELVRLPNNINGEELENAVTMHSKLQGSISEEGITNDI